MRIFVEKYFITIVLLVSFLTLSPLATEWFTESVLKYFLVITILSSSNFLIELFASREYSNYKEKIKKLSPFLLPINWAITALFIFFIM